MRAAVLQTRACQLCVKRTRVHYLYLIHVKKPKQKKKLSKPAIIPLPCLGVGVCLFRANGFPFQIQLFVNSFVFNAISVSEKRNAISTKRM